MFGEKAEGELRLETFRIILNGLRLCSTSPDGLAVERRAFGGKQFLSFL